MSILLTSAAWLSMTLDVLLAVAGVAIARRCYRRSMPPQPTLGHTGRSRCLSQLVVSESAALALASLNVSFLIGVAGHPFAVNVILLMIAFLGSVLSAAVLLWNLRSA
jgi:hypothetical protein